MNDFARSQLEKYGWKEGKGLGKNESGIKSAIKPSLKFDKSGLGHDASEEFSFRWWEHIFDKTAKNIKVINSENEVKILRGKNEVNEIFTKKSQVLLEKSELKYGSFISGNIINNNEEVKNDETEPIECDDDCNSKYSYEEIFKKCKGKTTHKAARHGIKMKGKLKRIEQQEKELLSKMNAITSNKKVNNCDRLLKKVKAKMK